MKFVHIAMVAALATAYPAASVFAQATGTTKAYSDRDRMTGWATNKGSLEKSLGIGQDRAHYRQALEKMGYWITAINYDRPNYLEYEIVKDRETMEVQVTFNEKTSRSTAVDVSTNAWRAESTVKAMRGTDYKYEYPRATTPNANQYSDRDRAKGWGTEKGRMEKALGTGNERSYYRTALEKMGYAVTAVNYDQPDYVEYEIVKGRDSYEVQISFDKGSGKSTKVDVTTNLWQAESTEKALGQK